MCSRSTTTRRTSSPPPPPATTATRAAAGWPTRNCARRSALAGRARRRRGSAPTRRGSAACSTGRRSGGVGRSTSPRTAGAATRSRRRRRRTTPSRWATLPTTRPRCSSRCARTPSPSSATLAGRSWTITSGPTAIRSDSPAVRRLRDAEADAQGGGAVVAGERDVRVILLHLAVHSSRTPCIGATGARALAGQCREPDSPFIAVGMVAARSAGATRCARRCCVSSLWLRAGSHSASGPRWPTLAAAAQQGPPSKRLVEEQALKRHEEMLLAERDRHNDIVLLDALDGPGLDNAGSAPRRRWRGSSTRGGRGRAPCSSRRRRTTRMCSCTRSRPSFARCTRSATRGSCTAS